MPRLPSTISFRRLREISSCRAASTWPSSSGFRNSSSRISPGGTAGPSQFGSLVIVFDRDFIGMSVLPPECHTILVVHANAEPAFQLALEDFQPIARWRVEVVHACGDVQHLQLSLHDPPDGFGNLPSGLRVALPKDVSRCLVRKRLNHRSFIVTRIVCNSQAEVPRMPWSDRPTRPSDCTCLVPGPRFSGVSRRCRVSNSRKRRPLYSTREAKSRPQRM